MDIAEYKNLARKPNKYKAVRTKVGDIAFASKLEANRYSELVLLERAGKIAGLELQPRFPIVWNGNRICDVLGDFSYSEDGCLIVEDCKGCDTQLSKLKRKLVIAFNPHLDWRVVKR
jgi:hypothetical protein